ncbi:hypothetical protein Ga0061065_12033 [Marinomonas fungiae]|uniref:Uncharacterized protein n=1 Tax=Marinomonas fungiae TaxID=1137284 RepID=A0A0K6IUB3_9GAMM|nr:hypothetical protein Ga0061065_12033 [Marinomonas fungiae]
MCGVRFFEMELDAVNVRDLILCALELFSIMPNDAVRAAITR